MFTIINRLYWVLLMEEVVPLSEDIVGIVGSLQLLQPLQVLAEQVCSTDIMPYPKLITALC